MENKKDHKKKLWEVHAQLRQLWALRRWVGNAWKLLQGTKPPGLHTCTWTGLPGLLGQDCKDSTLPSPPKGDAAGYCEAKSISLLERMNENQNTFEKLPMEQERLSIVTMGGHYICVLWKEFSLYYEYYNFTPASLNSFLGLMINF